MKSFFTCFSLLLFATLSFAQPAYDDCTGVLDLGEAPFCEITDFYTNIDATESDIGNDNLPPCWNGGNVNRDVWLVFTASDTISDYTIALTGSDMGPNGTSILNPQIAIYRGDCEFDGLAILDCASAVAGESILQLDVFDLDPGEVYFIRINDFSGSATPNSGDFNLCVEEYVPALNIGDSPGTSSCFGTLYDSGGPDGDYEFNENHVFTICPSEFHECIELNVVNYEIEPFFGFFGDFMNIYAGDNIGAPLIAQISGTGADFPIQATSSCVTVQFSSDGSFEQSGFELTWQCTASACDATNPDNPETIPDIPFTGTFTTCDDAATFASSPCNNAPFLNGPEYVFAYTSPGDECVGVQISGASANTGVMILSGPPNDPDSECLGSSNNGNIGSVTFEEAGTYYIIVANAAGCTEFDITMDFADCLLSPSLEDALCNPLNGCAEVDPNGELLPSIFFFQNGFQDIDLLAGVNDGCWLGVGVEPDFYWFTIQAQADGPFGFILSSADVPSDIDINVWGPFTEEQACENPEDVIDLVQNSQPIRSTWTGGTDPTGLTNVNPVDGTPVTDPYDCGAFPGAGGDGFVSAIPALEGEVYIVLANDWGNQIEGGGIQVEWGPSDPEVLEPVNVELLSGDTSICAGETFQIEIASGVDNITWITDTMTLSCNDCLDPIATPSVTTVYQAIVEGVCILDTVFLKIAVFDLDAGPDITTCLNEDFQIQAGETFSNGTYEWIGPNLSCTDCPDPIITTPDAGNFEYTVTLTGPTCVLRDTVTLEVLNLPAPDFSVSPNSQLCLGENLQLGDPGNPGALNYLWSSSLDPTPFSILANPQVSPTETTTYYVEVNNNGLCPVASMDSVLVEVFTEPTISLIDDIILCEGEIVSPATFDAEPGTQYLWTPDIGLSNDTVANPTISLEGTQTYTLTATRGACVETESVTITSITIDVDISPTNDLTICRGEEVNLSATSSPTGNPITWTSTDPSINSGGTTLDLIPQTSESYYASVSVPGCMRVDTIVINVDSLPFDLAIMPHDTTVCAGSTVILQTTTYEPSDFPELEILWTPGLFQQSPDSLLNLVVTPTDTIDYIRTIVNGVCSQMDTARIEIFEPTEITITPSDSTICVGESVQLLASSPDIVEFTWESLAELSCEECPDPLATPNDSATYVVTGEFEDCPIMASVTINVLENPFINSPGNVSICGGENVLLNEAGFDPNVTYTWTADPPDATLDPAAVQPLVSPAVTTTYSVLASNAICDDYTESLTVTIQDPLVVTFPTELTICAGDEAVITVEANTGFETIQWTPGNDNLLSCNNCLTPTVLTNDTILFNLFLDNGCETFSENILVNVIETYNLFLTCDPVDSTGQNEIIEGSPVIIAVGATNGPILTGSTIDWSTGQTGAMITATPDRDERSFTATVTTPQGCTSNVTKDFNVIEAMVQVPKAFTPDADGLNDYFAPIINNDGSVEISEFVVYNRWGQKVFDDPNTTQGWGGLQGLKPAPSDVYLYILEYTLPNGEIEQMKGSVTLIR